MSVIDPYYVERVRPLPLVDAGTWEVSEMTGIPLCDKQVRAVSHLYGYSFSMDGGLAKRQRTSDVPLNGKLPIIKEETLDTLETDHAEVDILEHDEGALKFLKDIKWSRIENPKGFKLEFFFDTNPYFSNSVLTKTYHMIDEDEPILEKAIGQILHGDLDFVSEPWPNISESAKELVKQMLDRDPKQRVSAHEVLYYAKFAAMIKKVMIVLVGAEL
ncbi:hypothetical protein RJT34_12318 [Clitoria ternatea]|uniref:Protein kinase domain-containing protein n=1 Tax=Clitoria ternatea TaxID=43366 RepID=A0AAN9JNL6_CLITE